MLSKCFRENNVSFFIVQRQNFYYYIDLHIVASFCVINIFFFKYIFYILLSVCPLFPIFVYSKIQNVQHKPISIKHSKDFRLYYESRILVIFGSLNTPILLFAPSITVHLFRTLSFELHRNNFHISHINKSFVQRRVKWFKKF